MKILWLVCLGAALCARSPAASILDVSNQGAIRLNTGDTLTFWISNLTIHTDPDAIEFQLVTQMLDPAALFDAELSSPDGSAVFEFPSLEIASGVFAGSRYNGPIDTLFGAAQLPPTFSSELFQNTRAILQLRNAGPSIAFGLPGYSLAQDLQVSLSAGTFSAGAVTSRALYHDSTVPESDSAFLFAIGVAILVVFYSGLGRFTRTAPNFIALRKCKVCNPDESSDTIKLADRKSSP